MKKKDYRPVVRKESIGSRQPIRNRVSDKKKGLFFPTHNKKKVKKKGSKDKTKPTTSSRRANARMTSQRRATRPAIGRAEAAATN